MLGISIKPTIGIGDALQFSSAPENYFRATGKRLVDVSRPWFFDHNPFVERSSAPTKIIEMWNFSPTQRQWPKPRTAPAVYLCNAEISAAVLGVPVVMNRPRLYLYEEFPFERRRAILLHTHGRSHGTMPDHVVHHVLKKYGATGQVFHVGTEDCIVDYGVPKIKTPTLWDLAKVISESRMLIGVDSGPAWIASCFPDVIVKKLRTKPSTDVLRSWVPLEVGNIHSHWDDRCQQIFNVSEEDVGFTSTYRKI